MMLKKNYIHFQDVEEINELQINNIIGDEVKNIQEQTSQEDIKEVFQQISILSDFKTYTNIYALVMFDLETTGYADQQIVQIGAWEMFTNSIFDNLVKPTTGINYRYGSLVHKIFDIDVFNKPDWKIVGVQFIDWMKTFNDKQIVLLSHGKCDQFWLTNEYKRVGLSIPNSWRFGDTIEFARILLGQKESVSLDSLSTRYQIQRSCIHRALPDIYYTWRFIEEMVFEICSNKHPFIVLVDFVFHNQFPEKLQNMSLTTPTKRNIYKCGYCGEPKKNHICKKKPILHLRFKFS